MPDDGLLPSARDVAEDVAGRLRDPAAALAAAELAESQSRLPRIVRWSAPSIAHGNAGIAILMAALDDEVPDAGWDRSGKVHLEIAVRALEHQPHRTPGLSSGIAGVAFAAHRLSRGGTRYGRLLAGLDAALLPKVADLVSRVEAGRPIPVSLFDVISGLSGIGAYLLARSHRSEAARDGLDATVAALAALVNDDAVPPRWHTPPAFLNEDQAAHAFGNLNCGLAHGIAGILALLALAALERPCPPAAGEAMLRIMAWLEANRSDDRWGVHWPAAFPIADTPGAIEPAPPTRCAWCYGPAGIARALWLGGTATRSTGSRDLALAAMDAIFRRPVAARMIDSPTLCHGIAGLLAIARRFEAEHGEARFGGHVRDLTRQLLGCYRPDSPLGFRSLEFGSNLVDHPGFLDGAAGVALALLDVAPAATGGWQRLLLIA